MEKPIQITLCKKTDADLISFFKQQNMRAATLVLIALYSYIKGEPVKLELLPVTVTEQTKRMNIFILMKETTRKPEVKKTIMSFVEGIPQGLLSIYVKGILRYMFGSCIYQTEVTQFCNASAEIHVTEAPLPDNLPIEDNTPIVQTSTTIVNEDNNDAEDDDIFDLLESLLD